MDQKGQEALEVLLTLSEDDRATIAEALLQSLASVPDEWDDEELVSELDRRLAEALNDPKSTVPWSALKDQG
jgi:putative addiction module component (TIGR02574 family)